jgi:hypothetical protein
MNDLRKAAEMALKYFEDAYGLEDTEVAIKEALRQALAHESLDEMVAENQRLGLYDTHTCKTHPDAPHGFDRNASHNLGRYVCECEFWEPPKRDNSSWVGLTDDEIAKYWGDAFAGNTQYVQKFARIIEAKLKEKNS